MIRTGNMQAAVTFSRAMAAQGKRVVCIDGRVITGERGHGIARHAEELVRHIVGIDTSLSFIILANARSPLLSQDFPSHFFVLPLRTGWIALLGQFELAYALWRLKPDIFHSPSFVVPLLSPVPLATTIHDLNHVALSDNYSFMHRLYYSVFLTWRVRRARVVLTVSEFSRTEIAKFFGIPLQKVKVVHNGIVGHGSAGEFMPRERHDPARIARFLARFELPERYILGIGNRKPHKNMARLVEAYCRGDFADPLVLLTDFDESLLHIADRYNKRHRVHFSRFIDNAHFPLLYCCASVFVYPSLYEGFGLPPLEASACGTPVVASERPSIPEILREGGVYVDPENVDDIVRGIRAVLDDPAATAARVERAKEIAASYSWLKMAQLTVSCFEEQTGTAPPGCRDRAAFGTGGGGT